MPVRNRLNTGIAFEDMRMELGLVPEYEEREAAAYTSCPWHEWQRLPTEERAAGIAHFRLHLLLGIHTQDAAERDRERKARKKGKK